MDPNYANAGGGGGGGVGIGASAIATAPAATVVPGGRYNAAYYKEPSSLTSCQRSGVPPPAPLSSHSHPAHYNTYDPYGSSSVSAKLPSSASASAYPYDAEAEFKERTGMGKATKILAGNVLTANSGGAKIQQQQQQHAYNQNSCYSYGQSNSVTQLESANYYAYAYEQQQQQYTQQQQQQYHQSQLHQQYKYNKLVAAQQQQQQQQQHSHKIPPPEYGYASYHHPYYHPHYHHQPSSLSSSSSSSSSSAAAAAASASSQKGVSMMKTIPPDAGNSTSSMPYGSYSSKMLSARAPQYSASSYYPHHYQPHNTYPMPVVTAGHHQHSTYQQQSQSVCEDSNRWIWNGVAGNGSDYYPNPNGGSCRSGASYSSAYTNGSGSGTAAPTASKQHHSTMWPPIQYQSTGYHSPSAMVAPNQSCCQPPPQSSTNTFYPQQYVKYSMHQPSITAAVDYNNDLYLNSPQEGGKNSGSAVTPTTIVASGKVYTDLSGNSYQQALNSHSQQHQQVAAFQQQHGELDYNNARYLQQQQHTESPSPSANSSSTYNHHHHYYHPYPSAYSSNIVETHHPHSHPNHHHHHGQVHPETTYQQQVDTKIKSQSLRDFLTSWNEDEDEMNSSTTTVATEVPGSLMDQMHLSSDHFAQETNTNSQPVMENHLQFKQSFSATSRPKIHVGITVDSTVESDQYINLPDIIIDIEKSNKDIVSLVDDSLATKLEKDDIHIKEEMPNTKEEPLDKDEYDVVVVDKNNPKTVTQQSIQRENKSRKKCRSSKRFHVRIKQSRHRQHKKLKIVRRKVIRRRVKKQPIPTLNHQNKLKSLKNLCVSVINSDEFRKHLLDDRDGEPRTGEQTNTPTTPNSATAADTSVVVVVNGDGQSSTSSKSSVIPKLSDLCKNALNSSFDRDVLVINLDEILDSDNLFVVQCDINENILENFVEQAVQLQEQQQQQDQPENSKIINADVQDDDQAEETPEAEEVAEAVEAEENLVEILNDNNNNSSSSSNRLSESNCSRNTNEVSNLPLDKSLEQSNNFNLSSVNPLLATPPLPSCPPPISPSPPPPPPSPLPASDDGNGDVGSIPCPVAMLLCDNDDDDDCRGHDHSSLLSPLPLPLPLPASSIDCGNPTDNNQHEMLTLSEVVVQPKQNDIKTDNKTFLLPTQNATPSSPSQSTATTAFDVTNELLLLESPKVVTTPSIHHEEIVPDNLKKFQNEKFLKYLHAKYVQGNLSEFYHANRIIKKYKKRIIKKLLNIVR